MSTKSRWWWKWVGTRECSHGRATFFCGTVNEVTVSFPTFEQAHALANAIEAQTKVTRYDARYGLLQDIARIEP